MNCITEISCHRRLLFLVTVALFPSCFQAHFAPVLQESYDLLPPPSVHPNELGPDDLALAGAKVMGMLVKPEKLADYGDDQFRYNRLTNQYRLERERQLVRKYRTLDVFGDIYQYPNGAVHSRDFGYRIHNRGEDAIRPYEKERRLEEMRNDAREMLLDKIIETIKNKNVQDKLSWPFFSPKFKH